MDVRTYRAATLRDALALVRTELGPDAAVLHTREVKPAGLLGWLSSRRDVEITASREVVVPNRLVETPTPAPPRPHFAPAHEQREAFRDDVKTQLAELQNMVEDLCRRTRPGGDVALPNSMFQLYADLIEAELSDEVARELVEWVRRDLKSAPVDDPLLARAHLARMLEAEMQVAGPIRLTAGVQRLVALVGPTGVGKTTTIAKLAANFRLRERRRVGLITVDTYRIAAVEQLRTYADIIDLPMEVVSTPREMRQAVQKMAELDLVLLDTAGRSPKDEVKIQELRSFLTEAHADEVHLVLSSVAGAGTLARTAAAFAEVGATSLILTKLDEATGLGNLIPLVRTGGLPLSYVTDGQNVPDDIEPADAERLTRLMLGLDAPMATRRW